VRTSYILKAANPVEHTDLLDFQQGAMLHLEEHAPTIPVPRVIRTRDGRSSFFMHQEGVGDRMVRLLSFLDGELLHKTGPSPAQRLAIGQMSARLSQGLAGYRPVVPTQTLVWDISQFLDLIPHAESVAPERRPLVDDVIAEFRDTVLPRRDTLPRQVIHNDFNPFNILTDPRDAAVITGIIDFGDMVEAARVNDLAVALAYHLAGAAPRIALADVMRGYASVQRLTETELELLPCLIRARLATTVIVTEWRAAALPANRAYIMRNHPSAMRGLTFFNATDPRDIRMTLAAANRSS
jgi:Ser/Thr protein kinase RdoA (MazF antagonist)